MLFRSHWRRQWQPTPVFLPGESQGRRSLVGSVRGVTKSRTRLSDFTFTFHFHALEKEMAAHSRVRCRAKRPYLGLCPGHNVRLQGRQGSWGCMPPLEVRPSSVAPDPAESRGAPPRLSMHWKRKWQPTPVFLPGESQGRRSLVGCRLRGRTEIGRAHV